MPPIFRSIASISAGIAVSDGAGVRIRRIIGEIEARQADPFLLLDEIRSADPSEWSGGFPDHPHRGFEIITYLISGNILHRDFSGNEIVLRPRSLHVITAGKGIIHREHLQGENGLLHGYQLWLNLPSRRKMCEPGFVQIPSERIPVLNESNSVVNILSGSYRNFEGPIHTVVPINYFDVRLRKGGEFSHVVQEKSTAMIYAIEGSVMVGNTVIEQGKLARLAGGEEIRIKSSPEADARFLFLSGMPLGEAISWGGPFVMNTQDEIDQAFMDFDTGKFLDI